MLNSFGSPDRGQSGIVPFAPRLELPQGARVLVIVLRRLGDVLLATPVLRTLRRAYPQAIIDVLVFEGTQIVLQGNPDINSVLTLRDQASTWESLTLIGRLWRRYDLAISTQTGDRPTLFAYAAGRRRAGLAPAEGVGGARWKRRVLHWPVTANPENHRVLELLRLTEALGLASDPRLVCSVDTSGAAMTGAPIGPYAVLHANPMYRLRRWTDDAWRALARSLNGRMLAVVATGSANPAERAYLDALWEPLGPLIHRLDGRLNWQQLTTLISRAAVCVGPDTSVTHLAAGTGCPTVALYGPASPTTIGPWPVGGLAEPWAPAGRIQNRGNVWVVQNPLPCLPCDKLGCEGHYESHSRCLDELSVEQVLAAVDQALQFQFAHTAGERVAK